MENRVNCDDVKLALAEERMLDDEILCHLKNCDDCRTFKEQTEKMVSELNLLGKNGVLSKNGESVADAVMNEIRKQSVFMGRKEVAGKGFFRHFGLVAACVVIMVVAYPVIENMFLAKSADSNVNINMESADMLENFADGNGYSDYEIYENETEAPSSNTIISASGSEEFKNYNNVYTETVKEKKENSVTLDSVYTEDYMMPIMSARPESSEDSDGTTAYIDDSKTNGKLMYASGTQFSDKEQNVDDEAEAEFNSARTFAETELVRMGYESAELLSAEHDGDNGMRYEFLCNDGTVCVIVVALSEHGELYTVSFSEFSGE